FPHRCRNSSGSGRSARHSTYRSEPRSAPWCPIRYACSYFPRLLFGRFSWRRKNKTADPFGGRPREYQIKRIRAKQPFGLLLDREDLTAAIHASLEIHVMRTTQLTRILVFDIGGVGNRVGRATETALHRRGFAFWHCHGRYSEIQNR